MDADGRQAVIPGSGSVQALVVLILLLGLPRSADAEEPRQSATAPPSPNMYALFYLRGVVRDWLESRRTGQRHECCGAGEAGGMKPSFVVSIVALSAGCGNSVRSVSRLDIGGDDGGNGGDLLVAVAHDQLCVEPFFFGWPWPRGLLLPCNARIHWRLSMGE